MFSLFSLALALLVFSVTLSQATLYVTNPSTSTKCHGGKKCTVEWLDDGVTPLLEDIGASTVSLYTGNQQLVQTISVLDVSGALSLTFTPNPAAGQDSDDYYICFTSLDYTNEDGSPYLEYSTFFSIDNMSGSFDSPLPEATASQPIPSSLTGSAPSTPEPISTRTVGTLSTSRSSIISLSATPPSSTYTPTTSSHSSSSPSSSPSSSNNGGSDGGNDDTDAAFPLSPSLLTALTFLSTSYFFL